VFFAPEQLGGNAAFLELSLPASSASVPRARHEVARFADGCDADPLDVATAVSEAVSNAVLHAYRDDVPEGEVRVKAFRRRGELVVVVEDDGVGMKPNLDSAGLGMGSTLIASMAAKVTYDTPEKGVRVTMHFPCVDHAAA
jgi:anti-sigma regulatory factor (Ser/Thr protein kinase)